MHDELLSLLPKIEFTRREFVVTTLATGFALAVQPVAAQTITTDTTGLEAGEVKITVADGEMPAYRAMPAGGKNLPTVLVVQEIFGVHEHIKDLCRRLAKAGYLAVAPELYARQGDASKIADIRELITKIVSKVSDAQVMSDLDATAEWAAKSGGNPEKVAITGFCWGGRIVWLYSAHSTTVKAGVAWYGRLKTDVDELHPKHPIDLVDTLHAPVLGLYAGKDGGIPLETVEAMKKALADAKKPSEIVVYPDAEHGFNADYRPSYNRTDAEDGWKRMLAWFKQHGVA
jgi:carboxymethylenebutenolidase